MKNLSNAELDRFIIEREQPGLCARRASEIKPERIEFIWPGRLALGKHTAIAGHPGDGKSQASIYIAARITTGGYWPCGEGRAPKGSVIFLSAEDGAADTIVPRLIAADADLKCVYIVSAVREETGGRRAFNLQADLALLERKIREIGDVSLVIIDPISSYMGRTDSHKNSEVRGVLEPVSEMAERMRVAILSITHFSKAGQGNTTKALHRFIGSIAFTGAPRAAFAVIPDADHEGRILFLHGKNNLAPPPQGLAYRIEQTILPDNGIVASRVVWEAEPVTISADAALAAEGGTDKTARDEATEFLCDLLHAGAVPAKEVKADTDAAGLSWATIRRAKDRLGVKAVRESDGTSGAGRWLWSLPDAARCSLKPQEAQVNNVSTLETREHLAEKACRHCGRNGETLTAFYGGDPIQLHRECLEPFMALEIPPMLRRS